MAAIPPHNLNGVLPPFIGSEVTQSAAHSPYRATLVEVVDRFATSQARVAIFDGFLKLRAELKSLGMVKGVQWLNGSFTERIGREPNDLDVITIFSRPHAWSDKAIFTKVAARTDIFNPDEAKAKYRCDAYYLQEEQLTVRALLYWYGIFTHRRGSYEWKGLVEVDLSEDDSGASSLVVTKVFP